MQANTRIKVACDVLKKMKELTTEFQNMNNGDKKMVDQIE